jgi:hypothetical protein
MRLTRALLLLGLFAWIGCSSDPPNISGTCTAPAQGCDEGLTCDTDVAGGYCTKTCTTAGSTAGCPDGSICDTLSGTALSCVKLCSQQADCRSDLECNGVSGSSAKACKIKATAP